MLGRLLGHSPGLWQRVARPVFRPARAAGSKAKNVQDMALQMADPGKEAFRNERRPTNFDKKVLVWSGHFKKEEDILRHISSEVLDTSRNIARIKVCYIMIALTVLGCVTMIIMGKEESIVSGGIGSLNVWSIGDTGIGKHNLLINMLLLTHAAIILCSAMLYMTVSQPEAAPKAAKKDQTLLRVNAEKKAKWRAEVEKGQEAAVGKSQ